MSTSDKPLEETVEKIKETFVVPWWTKAWNWFRKWGWVPLGFLFLLIVFILGGAIFRRRDGKVITPLKDIQDSVKRHNEEVDAEIAAAQQVHVDQVIKIERQYQDQIDQLTEAQQAQRQELRRNPKKLASWLTGLARGE